LPELLGDFLHHFGQSSLNGGNQSSCNNSDFVWNSLDNEILDVVQVPTRATRDASPFDMEFEYRFGYNVHRYFQKIAPMLDAERKKKIPFESQFYNLNRQEHESSDFRPESIDERLLPGHSDGITDEECDDNPTVLPENGGLTESVFRWWLKSLSTPKPLLSNPSVMTVPGVLGNVDQVPFLSQKRVEKFKARILPTSLTQTHIDVALRQKQGDVFFNCIPADQCVSTISGLVITFNTLHTLLEL
jgi:hypothetical protein